MNDLLNILSLTILGSVVALIGGVIFLSVEKWTKVLAKYSVPFAAGVLVTTSLLGLLPEATHMIGNNAYTIVLVTFIGAYLFETWFCDLHHHDHEDDHCNNPSHNHSNFKSSAPLVIIGDTIHNFIDGVAIAASYLINPGLGLVTAISTFMHEVPHEIGDFGILLKAGYSKKRVFLTNLFSALSTVVGALVVYFWVSDEGVIGVLMAIAAGMFLYLGASDFLPKAKGMSSIKTVIVMLVGVGLMYLTLSAVPHSHKQEGEHEHQGELIEEHEHGLEDEY
jgi:zinc and cadmium transporter